MSVTSLRNPSNVAHSGLANTLRHCAPQNQPSVTVVLHHIVADTPDALETAILASGLETWGSFLVFDLDPVSVVPMRLTLFFPRVRSFILR